MRLVHEPEPHPAVVPVAGRELAPKVCELLGRRAVLLPDPLAVPPRVVVQVNDAVGARREAPAHELVVVAEVGRVQRPAEVVVD